MTHVHIIPNGSHFSLRVGRFLSVVGYQTAEAAGLDVATRDSTGYGLPHCLESLTKKQAHELGAKLDVWLVAVDAFQRSGSGGKSSKAIQEASASYKAAMTGVPVGTSIKSMPKTVDEATFSRRMEAAGVAAGSRFVR